MIQTAETAQFDRIDRIGRRHLELWQILYNRTVCLVGGAGTFDHDMLDIADVVIRTNRNVLHQGGRCDAVYCSGWRNAPHERVHETRFICVDVSGDDLRPSNEWEASLEAFNRAGVFVVELDSRRYGKPNPRGPVLEWANAFGWELGTTPLTGVLALKHISLLPVKTIYVTGFNFYSFEGCIPLEKPPHSIFPQLQWLINFEQWDQRVIVDDQLSKLLDNVRSLTRR